MQLCGPCTISWLYYKPEERTFTWELMAYELCLGLKGVVSAPGSRRMKAGTHQVGWAVPMTSLLLTH